jgi:hypothetical protein
MEVVKFALRIPVRYKIYQQGNNQIEKWILRTVVSPKMAIAP